MLFRLRDALGIPVVLGLAQEVAGDVEVPAVQGGGQSVQAAMVDSSAPVMGSSQVTSTQYHFPSRRTMFQAWSS